MHATNAHEDSSWSPPSPLPSTTSVHAPRGTCRPQAASALFPASPLSSRACGSAPRLSHVVPAGLSPLLPACRPHADAEVLHAKNEEQHRSCRPHKEPTGRRGQVDWRCGGIAMASSRPSILGGGNVRDGVYSSQPCHFAGGGVALVGRRRRRGPHHRHLSYPRPVSGCSLPCPLLWRVSWRGHRGLPGCGVSQHGHRGGQYLGSRTDAVEWGGRCLAAAVWRRTWRRRHRGGHGCRRAVGDDGRWRRPPPWWWWQCRRWQAWHSLIPPRRPSPHGRLCRRAGGPLPSFGNSQDRPRCSAGIFWVGGRGRW